MVPTFIHSETTPTTLRVLIGMAWGLRGRYSQAGNIVARRFSRDIECLRYRIYRHTDILTYLDGYAYKNAGMIKGTLNRTTNLFVLLIVISFIFPATAIRYAQAATENSQESNSTGSGQESNSRYLEMNNRRVVDR